MADGEYPYFKNVLAWIGTLGLVATVIFGVPIGLMENVVVLYPAVAACIALVYFTTRD
ncbi:MAG: hypothetical protein VCA55_04505 [Verrucomicrobiales bacterium]